MIYKYTIPLLPVTKKNSQRTIQNYRLPDIWYSEKYYEKVKEIAP